MHIYMVVFNTLFIGSQKTPVDNPYNAPLHHDLDCGHTIQIFAQDSDGNTRSIVRNQFILTP